MGIASNLSQYLHPVLAVLSAFLFFFQRHVTRWMTPPSMRPARLMQRSRKVLVIGGDYAEGKGDSIVCGREAGLARRLARLLESDKRIHNHWSVVNMGVAGSLSKHWLPDAAETPSLLKTWQVCRRPLWQWIHDDGYGDAPIVVIAAMGSQDYTQQGPHTVSNILSVADALRDEGKEVIISYLGSHFDPDHEKLIANYNVNRKLRRVLEEREKKEPGTNEGITLCCDLDKAMFLDGDLFARDGLTFNELGYDKFARKLIEELSLRCIAHDFTVLKQMVTTQRNTKKNSSTTSSPSSLFSTSISSKTKTS
jgi:hypothetical protein